MAEILWLLPFMLASIADGFTFLHLPSLVELRPSQSKNETNFGFSMAYQPGEPPNLIVGAPHESLQGEVYICPFKDALKVSSINCVRADIDVNSIMGKKKQESHNLFLGAAISATRNFFLTCTPQWTDWVVLKSEFPAMGACFVYNGTAYEMQGPIEQFREHWISANKTLTGGFGWSLLADEYNNITLIPKSTPEVGDIMTLHNSLPLNRTKSLVTPNVSENNVHVLKTLSRQAKIFEAVRNPGYAMSAGHFLKDGYYYVASETRKDMKSRITFFKYSREKHQLEFAGLNNYLLSDYSVGSMYGAALCSADINRDGLTDLLIGAPTYAQEEGFENGAVHIFSGGPSKEAIQNKHRIRSIFCSIDGARFGSAIVSVDLDHDNFPELIISAPYAEATGIVYIISGYEINKLFYMDNISYKAINLENLKLVQMIQNSAYKHFGYSLQVVPDLDATGCDALVIGSPGSGIALLYPCLPSVNVTLFARLKGLKFSVPEEENNFTVEVCLNATDNFNSQIKVLDFVVTNQIIGNALMDKEYTNHTMHISFKNKGTFCKDIFINLTTNEPELYQFKTEARLITQDSEPYNKGNRSAVALSLYSETKASLDVVRKCEGEECMPHLNSAIFWSGSSPYTLGSSQEEHLILTIRNEGNSTYTACARVVIEGAQVLRIGCEKASGFYVCLLPKPMKRFKEMSYKIHLNMSSITNLNQHLQVNVSLYNFCEQNNYSAQFLNIPYTFRTEEITIMGIPKNRSVTARELHSEDTVSFSNIFKVVNSGSVTWENIAVDFDIKNQPFITKTVYDCGLHTTAPLNNSCVLGTLVGNSSININVYMELDKAQLRNSLNREELDFEMESNVTLSLSPTEVVKKFRLLSRITLVSEVLSFWHNPILVIGLSVLLAVIGLGIVIFILTKMNFFKRKQKEKLEDLKDNIRRSISVAPEDQLKDIELQTLRQRKLSNMGRISEENLVDEMQMK